jgi:hypothetical protein
LDNTINKTLIELGIPVAAMTPREVHVWFLEAFNRTDVEALVWFYKPGAVLATQDRLAKGHQAIRAANQHIMARAGRVISWPLVETGGVNARPLPRTA